MTGRLPRCRYLVHRGPALERCTGEVVEEGAEIELCTKHLAASLELIRRKMPAAVR